jgi:hypothetical protein
MVDVISGFNFDLMKDCSSFKKRFKELVVPMNFAHSKVAGKGTWENSKLLFMHR